ncbi:transcript antisense to ribosomal RNA protein [Echinococcus multilocularis]|uniref:Transcript antisense to ribosomal RNA protein n=1 Tax=Echinococcus multilocularis TaxID=6211 RepID=A0A0S4MMG0_ECHMU|nr:transcript antisense to ribosomal RNA protein [Echinococcus multilocularis]
MLDLEWSGGPASQPAHHMAYRQTCRRLRHWASPSSLAVTEGILVGSSPPLIDMLKFSGYPPLIRGQKTSRRGRARRAGRGRAGRDATRRDAHPPSIALHLQRSTTMQAPAPGEGRYHAPFTIHLTRATCPHSRTHTPAHSRTGPRSVDCEDCNRITTRQPTGATGVHTHHHHSTAQRLTAPRSLQHHNRKLHTTASTPSEKPRQSAP